MSTLLRIDSSPMGEHSISRKLTSQFTNTWAKAHPHATLHREIGLRKHSAHINILLNADQDRMCGKNLPSAVLGRTPNTSQLHK